MGTYMMAERQRRTFRLGVWIGRAIGWALLLVAIVGMAEAEVLPSVIGGLQVVPFLAAGLMAIIWIVGFELFLRFFDRYLSSN
jgi:hypothetical protein